MKKARKVLVAGTLVLSMFAGTMLNHSVSAAPSGLESNGDFEELKTSNIGSYAGVPAEMEYGTWYTKNRGVVSYTGYNESERSGMLPGNNGDTWLGQAIQVEKNTDYVFTAYVKTSLASGNAALEILDADFTAIEQYWIGGTEWQEGKVAFNSGDRDRVFIRLIKWSDDETSDVYQSEVYIDDAKLFTKADYEQYREKQEAKTKLVNLIGHSDLVGLTNEDMKANDGWPLGWSVGDYYSNASSDNPTVIGEGYGENAKGFVLPKENGDVWLRTIADVQPNTDYLFKVWVKHSDPLAGMTVSVEGPNSDGSTTRLGETWPGGTSWSDVEIKFNSGDYGKVLFNVYKYGPVDGSENEQATYHGTVNISDMRLYEVAVYDKVLEEEKEEEQEEQQNQYTEVWCDDFDTLDMSSCTYQLGHKRGIEPQDYVDNVENVKLSDGHLILSATEKDQYRVHYNADGSDIVKKYDSGSIGTFGKREFLYGKIEVRAKLPKGAGAFPAIWTLGNDFTQDGLVADNQGVGWPMCGEIDIMELIGANPDVPGTSDSTVHGTIHNGLTVDGDKAQTNTYTLPNGEIFNSDFHTFSIVWNPETIQWYVDDNLYSTIYTADLDYFQKPHYLLLNLAAGGVWPGFPNEDTPFPMNFEIDYVKYSQTAKQKAAAEKYYESCPTISGVKNMTISTEEELKDLLANVSAQDYNGQALEVN